MMSPTLIMRLSIENPYISAVWWKRKPVCSTMLCLCLLWQMTCFAGSASGDIVDLGDRLGIVSARYFFKVGSRVFLCVRDKANHEFLLDPVEFTASAQQRRTCSGFGKEVIATVPIADLPIKGPMENVVGFSGAKSIELKYKHMTDNINCDPYLTGTYTVTYLNGSSSSFFLIGRLQTPDTISVNEDKRLCGNVSTGSVEVRYDQVLGLLESIDAGNGTTLLYAPNAPPVILLVRTLPDAVWSSKGNVYIIAADKLQPQLNKAGPDPVKKYRVLLRMIGQAPQ